MKYRPDETPVERRLRNRTPKLCCRCGELDTDWRTVGIHGEVECSGCRKWREKMDVYLVRRMMRQANA